MQKCKNNIRWIDNQTIRKKFKLLILKLENNEINACMVLLVFFISVKEKRYKHCDDSRFFKKLQNREILFSIKFDLIISEKSPF
jgi:hypothetical protein